ncbi:hypothetical protein [Sphingomonas zeae]|jgi:hypothetical protein
MYVFKTSGTGGVAAVSRKAEKHAHGQMGQDQPKTVKPIASHQNGRPDQDRSGHPLKPK